MVSSQYVWNAETLSIDPWIQTKAEVTRKKVSLVFSEDLTVNPNHKRRRI